MLALAATRLGLCSMRPMVQASPVLFGGAAFMTSQRTCRSCGQPRDNDYVLMCLTCIRNGVPIPDARSANIHVEQLGNGYWLGVVDMTIPRFTEALHFENSLFHNADEALTWARQQIESVILSV